MQDGCSRKRKTWYKLQLLSSTGITADDITAFNYLLLFYLTELLIFSYKCYSRDYCVKCCVKSLCKPKPLRVNPKANYNRDILLKIDRIHSYKV